MMGVKTSPHASEVLSMLLFEASRPCPAVMGVHKTSGGWLISESVDRKTFESLMADGTIDPFKVKIGAHQDQAEWEETRLLIQNAQETVWGKRPLEGIVIIDDVDDSSPCFDCDKSCGKTGTPKQNHLLYMNQRSIKALKFLQAKNKKRVEARLVARVPTIAGSGFFTPPCPGCDRSCHSSGILKKDPCPYYLTAADLDRENSARKPPLVIRSTPEASSRFYDSYRKAQGMFNAGCAKESTPTAKDLMSDDWNILKINPRSSMLDLKFFDLTNQKRRYPWALPEDSKDHNGSGCDDCEHCHDDNNSNIGDQVYCGLLRTFMTKTMDCGCCPEEPGGEVLPSTCKDCARQDEDKAVIGSVGVTYCDSKNTHVPLNGETCDKFDSATKDAEAPEESSLSPEKFTNCVLNQQQKFLQKSNKGWSGGDNPKTTKKKQVKALKKQVASLGAEVNDLKSQKESLKSANQELLELAKDCPECEKYCKIADATVEENAVLRDHNASLVNDKERMLSEIQAHCLASKRESNTIANLQAYNLQAYNLAAAKEIEILASSLRGAESALVYSEEERDQLKESNIALKTVVKAQEDTIDVLARKNDRLTKACRKGDEITNNLCDRLHRAEQEYMSMYRRNIFQTPGGYMRIQEEYRSALKGK